MLDDVRRLVPTQIRRSYAAKFGIVLLVIGLSVGFIGSAATITITDGVQNNANEEYSGLAAQEANTVEQWIERNRLSTTLTSNASVLRLGDGWPIEDYLATKHDQLPDDVYALHLVDLDDQEVVGSTALDTQEETIDATGQPWWDTARGMSEAGSDEVAMTDVFQGSDGSPYISFTSPVLDSGRVLVVTYETTPLATNNFQGSVRTDGGFTQVVDGSDTIVFDEHDRKALESYPDDGLEPVEQARGLRDESGADSGVVSMGSNPDVFYEDSDDSYRNGDYIAGYAPVEGTDWMVVVHAPQSEAYGFVTTVSQWGLLATFAGVALITVLGAILGRNTASAIDRLTAKTQRMEAGDLSVDFETDRIDNIGRLYDAFGSMRNALHEQIKEAQSARQEAEEARENAEQMTRHLEEKADEYSEVMEAVGEGDLTRRMDPESYSEPMEEIAVEFNAMIAEIEETTLQVKEFATEVATSSEEVTASTEEVRSASEQVTESTQEISDGAERQNDQLQNVSTEMNALSTTIEEIASSATEVAELSQQTAETGDDAREAAEQAIDEMETVESEAEATVTAMEDLQARMEQIEEITEFITDVAEQTNILALNANIEAARAGEAGEGFAVVAEEVKGLAEETREAAEEIDQLVEDLRVQTETTATEVRQTSEEVAQSVDIVEETVDALEEIAGYAEETNTGIQGISDATTEQASSTNQVVEMVDEATSISEQTARESENVAAAAEEQTSGLLEVTQSASALAEQASRLSGALERFETRDDPLDTDDDEPSVDHERYRPEDAGPTDAEPADDEAAGDPDGTDESADADPAEPTRDEPADDGAGVGADLADTFGIDLETDAAGDIEIGDLENVVDDADRGAGELDVEEGDTEGTDFEETDSEEGDAEETDTEANDGTDERVASAGTTDDAIEEWVDAAETVEQEPESDGETDGRNEE